MADAGRFVLQRRRAATAGTLKKVDQTYPVMSSKLGFARNKWVSVLFAEHGRSRAELVKMPDENRRPQTMPFP